MNSVTGLADRNLSETCGVLRADYPYVVYLKNCHRASDNDLFSWLVEHFGWSALDHLNERGDRWLWESDVYRFRFERDAIEFKLRWA